MEAYIPKEISFFERLFFRFLYLILGTIDNKRINYEVNNFRVALCRVLVNNDSAIIRRGDTELLAEKLYELDFVKDEVLDGIISPKERYSLFYTKIKKPIKMFITFPHHYLLLLKNFIKRKLNISIPSKDILSDGVYYMGTKKYFWKKLPINWSSIKSKTGGK